MLRARLLRRRRLLRRTGREFDRVLRARAASLGQLESGPVAQLEPELLARLRTMVRRRVRSSADVDDVVQEVALRLVSSGERAPIASPHAWLAATARRAVADHHRSRARAGRELSEDAVADDSREHAPPDVARCLAPLMNRLEASDRALLERVDVRGERQVELARELGLSISGLKSRVQRARLRLRRALLERCDVELDRRGQPSGDARCRSGAGALASDCGSCGA